MRFQDWDVLLFPAGDDNNNNIKASNTHIPLQEFRTACHVEQEGGGGPQHLTPLLTTFVPTLPRGSPFQISLHSWTQTAAVMSALPNGVRPRELWQVVVVVDGVKVCVRTFEAEEKWPQVIASTTTSATGQAEDQLKFPRFHRIIMGQNHWDAADLLGRIRVELSSGYVDPSAGHGFVKLHNVVNFAFQPAPIDLLEQTAIAWPNQRMYMNPTPKNPYNRASDVAKHRRTSSLNGTTVHPTAAWPGYQPIVPPIPTYPLTTSDTSSRSTSAYSIFNDSVAPLLPNTNTMPMFTGSYADSTKRDPPLHFRLPSDQLQMILKAIKPNQQAQAPTQHAQPAAVVSNKMPPPPLPAHAVMSKGINFPEQHEVPPTTSAQDFASNVLKPTDRREQSRYSDISMHASCTDFPSCTSEDANGRIMHNAPTAPIGVVKGRKEGSSPAKPRDFFSTILDTCSSAAVAATAEQPGSLPTATTPAKDSVMPSSSSPFRDPWSSANSRKRTRSALMSLNLNDGSPEKREMVGKPPRKVSRGSAKSEQENVAAGMEAQENMMVDV